VFPRDGDASVGGIQLPSGRRRRADPRFDPQGGVDTAPALWISDAPVADVGDLWLALVREYPRTGLWPLIAQNLAEPAGTSDPPGRPWNSGEFEPEPLTRIGRQDARHVLAADWQDGQPDESGDGGASARAILAPLRPGPFPGLAAATSTCDRDAFARTARSLQGRIALIPVRRPADVITRLGWMGALNYVPIGSSLGEYDSGMSAVLRSWEDRFGAYLVGLGFNTATLAVTRPPTTSSQAVAITAEQFAFAPDGILEGEVSWNLRELAHKITDASLWHFYWH
jgi:hypothetical protein